MKIDLFQSTRFGGFFVSLILFYFRGNAIFSNFGANALKTIS